MEDLNKWWSSLTITQKERIATKAARKDGDANAEVHYPACSQWWNTITAERRQWIYEHCTDVHGLLLPQWNEAKTLSY